MHDYAEPAEAPALDADSLYSHLFNRMRDPRSTPYKEGVRAALEYRCNRRSTPTPYRVGTPEYDAFQAGVLEGHNAFRLAAAKQQEGW